MSGCALRRWGTGHTPTYRPDTQAAREMEQKLAAMQRERESQDSMWSTYTSPDVTHRPSPSSSGTGTHAPSSR
jgi:hypothetical protein